MLPNDYKELQKQFEKQRLEDIEKQRIQSPYYLSQQNRGVQYQTRTSTDYYKENDNIYANIVIDHPQPVYPLVPTGATLGIAPIDAKYDVTKNTFILDKCNNYYCSVIKFDIPLDNVPLLIMPIIPSQTNNDLTPLVIGIQFLGVSYPVYLIYLPESTMTLPPNFQNQTSQVINEYYFTYSYETLIRMTNFGLRQAYINSGIPALFAPGAAPPVPYFTLDPVTNLISLIAHTMWTQPFAPLTNTPQIYMNTELFTYYSSFYSSFQGYDKPNGLEQIFILGGPSFPTENQGYAPFGTAPTSPPTYYKFTQEYSVLEYWSSLRKILITTSTIPVNPEYVPTVNVASIPEINSLNLNNSSSLNVSFPILSDFTPNIEQSAGTSRSIAYYVPPGQYKLIDLISDNSLQKIDIQIYWQDRDGNNYPLEISVNQQISIKLAFFRKDLYKNASNLLK